MTVPNTEPVVTDTPTVDSQQTQQTDNGNPAWQELYSVLPDSLHGIARPVLEKWEQGSQQKIQEYAETAKRFEPYKGFVENNIAPEQIEQALAVAHLIDTDPKAFMEQMNAFFGQQDTSQQQQTQETEQPGSEVFGEQPFDIASDPRFQEMKQHQDIMANYLAQQAEMARQAEFDQALDQELAGLQQKYGDFDLEYVITKAAAGVELEDAVKQYTNMVEGIRNTPRPDANIPSILSPSGGTPSERVNPADMSDAQRRAYVMNMLAQANNQT